jgi:hypothetical protein
MRSPSGFSNAAAGMIVKRFTKQFLATAIVLGFGLVLGSCGQFSGYVADHWPHWAGGMPGDVPPRPGAPGYDEFIAHGQPDRAAAKSGAPGQQTAAGNVKASAQPAPGTPAAPVAPVTPVEEGPTENPGVVHGGLY